MAERGRKWRPLIAAHFRRPPRAGRGLERLLPPHGRLCGKSSRRLPRRGQPGLGLGYCCRVLAVEREEPPVRATVVRRGAAASHRGGPERSAVPPGLLRPGPGRSASGDEGMPAWGGRRRRGERDSGRSLLLSCSRCPSGSDCRRPQAGSSSPSRPLCGHAGFGASGVRGPRPPEAQYSRPWACEL